MIPLDNELKDLDSQEQHEDKIKQLNISIDAVLGSWARVLEHNNFETKGHCDRVTKLTIHLAQDLHIPIEELIHYKRGAMMHDIGKLGIPERIILKPGSLNEEEWKMVREHTELGFKWLKPVKLLKPTLDIVRYHHERWDGKGYPRGLKGVKIPLAARIFAVVDVCDALTHLRAYNHAWSGEETLLYLEAQAGEYFDPQVVNAFVDMVSNNHLEI
jgi:HD-GYP domain-containing protein (c-di-GMP phosphodiesterase class II)